MIFEFVELKTLYLILHLFAVAIGMGGALFGDVMFFSTMKDRRVTKTELRFLKLGSNAVWWGLLLFFISGIFLVLTDPVAYFSSTKFLAKMIVVAIIVANGVIFHVRHIPLLEDYRDTNLNRSRTFKKRSVGMFVSGATSITSWIFALVLGAFRNIPYGVGEILAVYVLVLLVAVVCAASMHWYMFKKKKK